MSAPGGSPLPPALRDAVEQRLGAHHPADLASAAAALSARYREAIGSAAAPSPPQGRPRAPRLPPARPLDVDAYLAVRLPATYAAIDRVLGALAEADPDFVPTTVTDVGAGPGTATWAAHRRWPAARTTAVERDPSFREAGAALGHHLGGAVDWEAGDLRSAPLPHADLVLAGYVLCELGAGDRAHAVRRLWQATGDVLVIVEPGTPAVSAALLEARALLVAEGAHLVAPCPHDGPCPLAPDRSPSPPSAEATAWCHFSVRVPRTRRHRVAKGGVAGFEDERFSYLVARRAAGVGARPGARVVGTPRRRAGGLVVPLCTPSGLAEGLASARDRTLLAPTRRLRWGDGVSVDLASSLTADPAFDSLD